MDGEIGKAAWGLLPGFLSFALLTLIISTGVALGAANYEAPSEKRASEVLPPNLRSGPHFKVQDQVAADGYMLRFTVTSDYGTFPVTGEYGLRKLIKEIQAIAALKKMSKGEAFVEGASGKAQETVEFGANLVTDPGRTLASVPQGVAKLFDNLATGVQKPREPRRDPVGQQLLNVSDAKRKIAYDLGVDVYSSNRVLQNELDGSELRPRPWGHWGCRRLSPMAAGPWWVSAGCRKPPVKSTGCFGMNRPAGSAIINERKLQAMGVDRSLTQRFLNHNQLSPRHQTVIVASLEKIVRG